MFEITGLYTAQFGAGEDKWPGVVVLASSRFIGRDDDYVYAATYSFSGSQIEGRGKVVRQSPGAQTVQGDDSVIGSFEFSGYVNEQDRTIEGLLNRTDAKSDVPFKLTYQEALQ